MICKACGNEINEDSKWFKDSKDFFHMECYVEFKIQSKRHKEKEYYIDRANTLYNKKMIHWNENKIKNDFWKYVQELYNITLIPKYTFMKMSDINNGTYNGLNKPIPLEDIYHMFQKKKNVLDKIYTNNLAKGMQFDSIGRFNYDLAILLSQYDKYKHWKEANEVKELTKDNLNDIKQSSNINKIIKMASNNQIKNTKEEINIDEILGDLYE